jgi:hypothetical protein
VYLVLGLVLLVVVGVAAYAWQRARTKSGDRPPEVGDQGPSAPENRRKDWDPRERYDG